MKVVYLVTDPLTPVVQSQVLENIILLGDKGVNVEVIFLLQLRHYFKTASQARKIMTELGIRHSVYPVPFQNSLFSKMVAIFWILSSLKLTLFNKTIFHCRGLRSSIFALSFKNIIKSKYVIYDVRGDYLSESEFAGWNKEELKKLSGIEKSCLSRVDHVLFVSKHLRNTILDRYSISSISSDVIYCTANERKVIFNQLTRKKIRSKLDFEAAQVFVYSGSIGRWHCFDKVIEVFETLALCYPEARFLILTNQKDEALRFLEKSPIATKSTVTCVPPQEIGDWLSAADVAVIIRKPHPLNYGASPVKVAEYIINGLPLIISETIKDYSMMIEESGIGLVLKDEILLDKHRLKVLVNKLSSRDWLERRNHYNDTFKNKLTKSYSVSQLQKIYGKTI